MQELEKKYKTVFGVEIGDSRKEYVLYLSKKELAMSIVKESISNLLLSDGFNVGDKFIVEVLEKEEYILQ